MVRRMAMAAGAASSRHREQTPWTKHCPRNLVVNSALLEWPGALHGAFQLGDVTAGVCTVVSLGNE